MDDQKRESGTSKISWEIVFPWMHRRWNRAVFGHSSQTGRPESNSCIGGMLFETTFSVIKGFLHVLHDLLLYEGMLTIQCAFVPISASTFCPSSNCVSSLVSSPAPIGSILFEAKYDAAAPTDDLLSAPTSVLLPPPSSFTKVVSESISPSFPIRPLSVSPSLSVEVRGYEQN